MARTPEIPGADLVIANLDTVTGLNNAIKGKVTKNTANGLDTYRVGIKEGWQGFPGEVFDRKITILSEFDEATADAVRERISLPIKDIAQKHGIKTSIPGVNDLPPHVTLLFPHYAEGTDPETIARNNELLLPQLKEATEGLEGSAVPFDRLVAAGPMIYMCVGDPTRSEASFGSFWDLTTKRQKSTAVFNASPVAMENPSYDDIIHSVVARIVGVRPGNLEAFAEEVYKKIAEPLHRDPIEAVIGSVYIGSGADQVNSVNSELLHYTTR